MIKRTGLLLFFCLAISWPTQGSIGVREKMIYVLQPSLLPQLRKTVQAEVASGVPVPVALSFPSGMKLSPDDPSWLLFYECQPRGERFCQMQMVKSYATSELLSNNILLPPLKRGWRYLLQGVFYYCAAPYCYVESRSQGVKAEAVPAKPYESRRHSLNFVLYPHP